MSNQGHETVLLVEDEASVRNLTARILKRFGYAVFLASDGKEGLRTIEKDAKRKIKLVITDMVMPKLGGKELAEILRTKRPDLKFIYTSGYMDEGIFNQHLQDNLVRLLRKPYTIQDLTHMIREILDG